MHSKIFRVWKEDGGERERERERMREGERERERERVMIKTGRKKR